MSALRRLVAGALLGVFAGFAWRAVSGRSHGEEPLEWPAPTVTVPPSTARPGPVDAAPPEQADPADREIESRLDEDLRYERLRDEEEAERAAAAARLRAEPLTERSEP